MFRGCFFIEGAVRVFGCAASSGAWGSIDGHGYPNKQHVGRAPLKNFVFVSATLQAKNRLGRNQASVRAVG